MTKLNLHSLTTAPVINQTLDVAIIDFVVHSKELITGRALIVRVEMNSILWMRIT
jgi:hypothetical protein